MYVPCQPNWHLLGEQKCYLTYLINEFNLHVVVLYFNVLLHLNHTCLLLSVIYLGVLSHSIIHMDL